MKKTYKKWLWFLLVALGVGAVPAAKIAGCPSGLVDDAKTVVIPAPTKEDPKAVKEIPNPTFGDCVEFE